MMCAILCKHASVVKWISRLTSDQLFRVRILAEALETKWGVVVSCRAGGYGSMVEHLVANQMMGVRFSLPAPKRDFETTLQVCTNLCTLWIKDRRLFGKSMK